MAHDPWCIQDARGRIKPAPAPGPNPITLASFVPPDFANIEHKCETSGAKHPVGQSSYFEPISETSESKCSEEVFEAVERILDEGMTDQQKRDEAARLSVGVPLPWVKREARDARDKVRNPFSDPSKLPAPSPKFRFGGCSSGCNCNDHFLTRPS